MAVNAQRELPLELIERKEAPMSAEEANIESAKAVIQALNQQWEADFENHNAAGLVALFTEDCIRMPQGGPATVGRHALEAAYLQDFAEVWETGAIVRLNAGEVIISGEYAFARAADDFAGRIPDGRHGYFHGNPAA